MATPWEDTIVIALRDIQWMEDDTEDVKSPPLPKLFIKLDGKAEKAMGDVIFKDGEKVYLFEVKSSINRISSEWDKYKDGKWKPKEAFKTIRRLMKALDKSDPGDDIQQAFWTSMKCHHFIYWSDDTYDDNDTFGNIMIRPYIEACSDDNPYLPKPFFDIEVMERKDEKSLFISASIPFSCVRKKTGYVGITFPGHDPENDIATPIGENIDRFVEYLEFLVKHSDGGDGSIRAIICSDMGSFSKVATSISDLKAQISSYRQGSSNKKTTPLKVTPKRAERPFPRSYNPPAPEPFPDFSPKGPASTSTFTP